ncbi:MAG: hypothetical protein GXP29_04150, partial [Planctomycetes bacterium]|nr:hypothetical protein [Planctomycetota bacterium]
LRNGVYRNFTHGVTWTKPEGFWRTSMGEEASAVDEFCMLLAEEAQSGLYVQWIVEDAGDFDGATFHQAVIANMFGEDHPVVGQAPESIKLNGATALMNDADLSIDGLMFTYRVATTIANGRGHQMIVWGWPGVMKQKKTQIDQAIAGFAFPGSSLVETVKALPTYRDNRVGFSVRLPGSGWTVNENMQPAMQPIGAVLQFQRQNQLIIIMALAAVELGQDISWASGAMTDIMGANFSQLTSSKPTTKQTTFAGIPWEVKTWKKDNETIHLAMGVRQRTIYAIAVSGADGTGKVVMDRITKGFRLLD